MALLIDNNVEGQWVSLSGLGPAYIFGMAAVLADYQTIEVRGLAAVTELVREDRCRLWYSLPSSSVLYLLQSSELVWSFFSIDERGNGSIHEVFQQRDLSKVESELRSRLARAAI